MRIRHLTTNKSIKSSYTSIFQRIFAAAGLDLNDPANIVSVEGHKGRHPKAYHDWVLNQLKSAKGAAGLKRTLNSIAKKLQNNPEMLTKRYWENLAP